MLRGITAVLAIAFTGAAAWFLYQAFFVLDRFGFMAILLAFALLVVAAVLSWLAAEGSCPEVRRRSLHVLVGGIIGLAVVTTAVAIPDFRQRGPRLAFADLGFIAGFMDGPPGFTIGAYIGFLYSLVRLRKPDRLTNRSSQPLTDE